MVVMSWFLLGAAVGLLAHRVFPGRTPVGRAGYVVAGVLGAELAGVTFAMVTDQGFGRPGPLGLLTSAAGAVVVIGMFRAASGTRDGPTRSTRS